jgi:hypothetical protein
MPASEPHFRGLAANEVVTRSHAIVHREAAAAAHRRVARRPAVDRVQVIAFVLRAISGHLTRARTVT